jgi:hypothetical protein
VALLSPIILALMAMIMLISGVDGFVVERDILASTMRREMMGSSIKNSNVEVTISRNPDGNDLYDAQSSHKGLTKSTGVTGHKKGLLCQGLSFDEVQVQYDENEVGLISVTCESEAGGAVIDASATLTNIGVSITNDNDNVGSKTHNATSSSPMTSEVLSDSLFNAGKLSSHQLNVDILSGLQFNVGNLSSYHLKVGDLSQSHVHKLSDSHASLASSSSDDDRCHYWILKPCCRLNCLAYQTSVTTCHCHRHSNCLACLQSVMTCHCHSSVTTYHCYHWIRPSLANYQLFSARLTS